MLKYRAGERVGKGTYWDLMSGQRVDIEREGILPGEQRALYLKTSASAILLLGPIFGIVYVMIMPIMGVVTILALLIQTVFRKPFRLIKNMVSFGWRPNEAYLSGKNKKKDGDTITNKKE